MEYTDKDVQQLRAIRKSPMGKWLVEYIERLKVELFRPGSVTKENVDARTEAVKLIDEHLLKPMALSEELGAPDQDEFE